MKAGSIRKHGRRIREDQQATSFKKANSVEPKDPKWEQGSVVENKLRQMA
jgi:hypothetical protein